MFFGAILVASLFLGYSFRSAPRAEHYVYRHFFTVESVMPGGPGRWRVIISDDSNQEISKELLNFYSLAGINFKNVANNDRVIVNTINEYTNEGWELYKVSTGVQSGAKNAGIFISRYLFRKPA